MTFTSASLLVEPPLISFLDERDYSSNLYSGTEERQSTKAQIPMLSPTKDLMDFDEKSPGDRLYAEIYQKNLRGFLESSLKSRQSDPTIGSSSRKQTVNIPSLIDDQVRIDGPSGASIDERSKQHTAGYLDFKKSNEHTEKNPKACKIEKNEPLLILSDTISEPTPNSDDGCSVSAGSPARTEQNVQFVHADPMAISPICNVGTHAKGSSHALSNVLHSGPGYLSNVVPSDSDYLSDLVPRDSDYLAGESSSSREEMRRLEKRNLSHRPPCMASHTRLSRTPRRIVKINLPYEILNTMQDDPQFDGYCHAWVRRPDFCRHGVNCHFIHDYPMSLVKKFGMVAVYIDSDGKEVKNPEQFLELDEVFVKSKWTKLEQGAMEGSPGCYSSNCRGFIGKDCKFGQKCWYKHPMAVVESDKWVMKDVRQLVDGGFKMHKLNGEEEVEISDGSWSDGQSSISHEWSPKPPKLSRASFSGSNVTHTLSHRPRRVTEEIAECPLGLALGSDGVDGVDRGINSDATEACHRSGSSYGSRTVQARSTPINDLDPESPTSLNQGLRTLHIKTIGKPAVTHVKHGNTTGDYNYWEDESPIEDESNYWKDAPPPAKVSRLSRRQHAMVSEAMTYAGLFREDSYKPQKAQAFVMPPEPLGTNWNSRVSRPRQGKMALGQVVQEGGEMRENLIDISTIPNSASSRNKLGNSYTGQESIFDRPSWDDCRGEASASGSDWTKPLKAMLEQKCEPIRWANFGHETKVNTLIDI